ncbi:MAG: protein phosphatase 2C domain-containing protein [Prevotellaceae bacterium]|jgi:protein phosphatase|nr:protein phosphatase 2C domain-containing protein [Prevotellaceae bacterium]
MQTFRYNIVSFSQIGKRLRNEDHLITGSIGDISFFMVCDGVGGQANGDIASRLVCLTFQDFFKDHANREINESYMEEALAKIRVAFEAHISRHPKSQQMATTLTLAILHPAGVSMFHLGDSRIYYFRNGKICYQTRDHSLINELIDNNIITTEEANGSNQNHIITRAVSSISSQSAHPSYHLQSDVQIGDTIFLCTDGVTESLSAGALIDLFTEHPDITDAAHQIKSICAQHSNDNYSGIIVQISDM